MAWLQHIDAYAAPLKSLNSICEGFGEVSYALDGLLEGREV